MQIAFIYGAFGHKPINFQELWTSPRGLTGSEVSCICYARELQKLGHDVALYFDQGTPTEWEGIPVRPLQEISDKQQVVISWCAPDVLRPFPNSLRVVNQQLNDFNYCQGGFDRFVDLYTSPSLPHKDMITKRHNLNPDKWIILPNGCYPDEYPPTEKIAGRVVYASSPDRGLHHLLACWPLIKEAAPHATLRIFYDIHGYTESIDRTLESQRRNSPVLAEWYRRTQEIKQLLTELDGVEAIGTVSRNRIKEEMLAAEVLAYPCDPVTWTEGFSVATLEGCAAGAVPIITSADALGEIYGKYVPTIFMPIKWKLDEYAFEVIELLNDQYRREACRNKARFVAETYAWPTLAKEFEGALLTALAEKESK